MSIDEIRSDFSVLDDWEDRYRYVIELGRMLPPLDDALKTESTKVRGCASQVWLVSSALPAGADEEPRLAFRGDSDALIVRGLVAILLQAIDGLSARQIAALDLPSIFAELGLKDNLTPQRSNGLASMIARIRADAGAALARA
jgi:cysteine desulfuration protein SufE